MNEAKFNRRVRELGSKGLIVNNGGDQERGPWITVKGLVVNNYNESIKFHNGKLKLNKTQVLAAAAAWNMKVDVQRGRPRVGATRGGVLNLGLRPNTRYIANLARNR